jgi:hypothetical protein
MSASQSSVDVAAPTSLVQVLDEHHRTATEEILEFARLAGAVQTTRFRAGVSDVEGVTRSTALWSLMSVDPGILRALEAAGLDHDTLARMLSLKDVPAQGSGDGDVALHEDFARALQGHLPEVPADRPLTRADLAIAIVRAGEEDRAGLLPERLREAGVDFARARAELEALLPPTPPVPPFDPFEFSASVRQVRDALGPAASVTASQIAAHLQRSHPGYGAGQFERVVLDPEAGEAAPTDDWLARVRDQYPGEAVARSRHQVIDGELTLIGLAALDSSLATSLRADGFLDALSRGVAVRPRRPTTDRTELVTDAPTDRDLLNRRPMAHALATRVRTLAASKERSSFLFHIDGPWGAGKSTVFGFLEQDLTPDFVVVKVDAWRDQRIGVPWWTLLSALRRAVRETTPRWRRSLAWAADLRDRMRTGWVPLLAVVLVIGAAVAGWLSTEDFDLKVSGDTADSVLKIVSVASATFAGLLGAARFLVPGSRRSAKVFVESNDNPMFEVSCLFGRVLRRAKRPVVFLIDNLDRCDEPYVVEFLEVLQTLVRDAPDGPSERPRPVPHEHERERERRREAAGPYVFVAADGRWIRRSYECHYEKFTETSAPGRPLGYLFLEKIFQLHVTLPAITQTAKDAFLMSLLLPHRPVEPKAPPDATVDRERALAAVRDATSEPELIRAAQGARGVADPLARMEVVGEAAARFSEPALVDAIEHDLAPFGRYLEPNPREMKLFVNRYGVLRTLRTLEENPVPPEQLALWTVIESRWPYLAELLCADPDAVDRATSSPDGPGEIDRLLQVPEIAHVFRHNHVGPLTAELVRASCGCGSEEPPERVS